MGNFERGGSRREGGFRKDFGGDSQGDFGRGPRRDFGRGPRRDFGPREMHKATCSDCGQECEVPFKPMEGKPVYCRDCFAKRRAF